jgi:hypothetical protein
MFMTAHHGALPTVVARLAVVLLNIAAQKIATTAAVHQIYRVMSIGSQFAARACKGFYRAE